MKKKRQACTEAERGIITYGLIRNINKMTRERGFQ